MLEEIIRCKNCKYWNEAHALDDNLKRCDYWSNKTEFNKVKGAPTHYTYSNDFCCIPYNEAKHIDELQHQG